MVGLVCLFFSVLLDMSGQLLTGLGFMFVVGGVASQIWVVLFAGSALLVLGFLLLRSG